MRKYIIVYLILGYIIILSACHKRVKLESFENFPNGKYTGVFVFDSSPTSNYTRQFVGIKSKPNKYYHQSFKFDEIYALDSTQLQIIVTDQQIYITTNKGYYISYRGSWTDNTITGKQIEHSDSTLNLEYPSSFTLTYTP